MLLAMKRLREAWFDFSTGRYGVSMTSPNYALWAGADTQTLAGVGALFAKMPARMRSVARSLAPAAAILAVQLVLFPMSPGLFVRGLIIG